MSPERRGRVNRYDFVASVFEVATWIVSLGQAPRVYAVVSDLLRVPDGSTVLEVGCGPATVTPYLLASTAADTEILGLDVAPRLIERARSKARQYGWTRAEFSCADFYAYEPESPPAAIVFCLALSALPDPPRALERALSILAEGGQLIVADSIPSWQRPSRWPASAYIRLKAALLGARPSTELLRPARDSLGDTSERTLAFGLYTIFAGRKLAAGEQHATVTARPVEPERPS